MPKKGLTFRCRSCKILNVRRELITPAWAYKEASFYTPFRVLRMAETREKADVSGVEVRREQSAVFGRTPGAVAETSSETPDGGRKSGVEKRASCSALKGRDQSGIGMEPQGGTGAIR